MAVGPGAETPQELQERQNERQNAEKFLQKIRSQEEVALGPRKNDIKKKITEQDTNRNELEDELTAQEAKAYELIDALEQDEEATYEAVEVPTTEPEKVADDDNKRGQAYLMQHTLVELAEYYKQNKQEKPKSQNEASKHILNGLIDLLSKKPHLVGSIYVFKIFMKAYRDQITNPLEVLTRLQFETFFRRDAPKATEVFALQISVAQQMKHDQKEIDDYQAWFMTMKNKNAPLVQPDDLNRREYSRMFGAQALDQVKEDLRKLNDPEATKLMALEFVNALDSREAFQQHMAQRVDRILVELYPNPQGQYDQAMRNEAAIEAGREVQRVIIYLMSRFFYSIYTSSPDKRFQEVAQYTSNFYESSPQQKYQGFLSAIQKLAVTTGQEGEELDIFRGLGIDQQRPYHHDRRMTFDQRRPKAEYGPLNMTDMIQQIQAVTEREYQFYQFGFDLRYLNHSPTAVGENSSYWQQMKQFAEQALTSTSIDEMSAMEYQELIMAAKMQIMPVYKSRIALNNWRSLPEMYRDVFSVQGGLDQEVFRSFVESYKAKGYSETILRRCFFHATTLAFGRDFGLDELRTQMKFPVSLEGVSTFKGIHDKLQRIGGFHLIPYLAELGWFVRDLTNNDEAFLPANPDQPFNPVDFNKAIEQARISYAQAQQFGRAAYVNGIPLIDEYSGNICGAGDINKLDGWRVTSSYAGWIIAELDPNIGYENLRMDQNDDQSIARSWKRVENIGIMEIKNFANAFLFKDAHLSEIGRGNINVANKYQRFFEFVYDRYYAEGSVGKAYIGQESQAAFVDRMMGFARDKDTTSLKKEMYHVLTIITFERMPAEFLTWERQDKTQNGVTLLSEIREKYVVTPMEQSVEENHQQNQYFTERIDDLIFVQQQARMETIEQMEQIRQQDPDRLNLYGDLADTFSQARREVTDGVIRDTLVGKYLTKEERDAKNIYTYADLVAASSGDPQLLDIVRMINDTADIYLLVREKVQKAPEHNRAIDFYDPQLPSDKESRQAKWSMRGKLTRAEKEMDHRLDCYADAWEEKQIIEPKDTAASYTRLSETGPDTIARAAGFAADTVEATRKAMMFDLRPACKEAAKSKSFDPLYNFIKEVKEKVEMADDVVADTVVTILARRIINTFRKDQRGEGFLNEVRDYGAQRTDAVSQTYAAPEDRLFGWSWGTEDVYNFLEGLVGLESGGILAAEHKQEMLVYGRCTLMERSLREYLPRAGLALVGVMIFAIQVALKDQKG